MQFAGQRTSLNLEPIGSPINKLIRLPNSVLPDPGAILITGITPQQTIAQGMIEVDFLKLFYNEAVTSDTIFVGYNNIRFDDEFMRFLNYRNFYDAYEWQWQDGRSRWDILDVARTTRALRPDGIVWPNDSEGVPTNRLQELAAANKLDHRKVHDAMSDVEATIALAKLIHDQQGKLFSFLVKMRTKNEITKLVYNGQPFLYTSSKYPSEHQRTTIVDVIADHPQGNGALVYDLRNDPTKLAELSPNEIASNWISYKPPPLIPVPIKTLQFNRCPAIAPLGVLDEKTIDRLQLNMTDIEENRKKLHKLPGFADLILDALNILDTQREKSALKAVASVETQLYDGFFDSYDKQQMKKVRDSKPKDLVSLNLDFHDQRLEKLMPLYVAQNFPEIQTSAMKEQWDKYRHRLLLAGGDKSRYINFESQLQEITNSWKLTKAKEQLVKELKIWSNQIIAELDGERLLPSK